MPEDLLLSVIVPAHNAASSLSSCLDAIIASDLQRDRWELIVVDDASADSTAAIAARVADLLIQTGGVARGPAYARNRGAEAARGELIAFVDSDVAVHRDAIRSLCERLGADTQRVAVFGSYDDRPHAQSLVSRYRNLLHHYAHRESAGEVATFWAGCGAVRAAAFIRAGSFDEARYPSPQIEDIELGYRLRRLGTILLDPAIQGTHYKRWSVSSMIKTDFMSRAVPWVRLLLASEQAPRSSTPSLGRRAMLGTAAAGGAAMAFILAAAGLGVAAWTVALILFVTGVFLNLAFYRWLYGRGGGRLLLAAIPLHFVYQILSAAAIPVGAVLYLATDMRSGRRAGAGSHSSPAGSRFLPLALGEIGSRVIAFAMTAWLARRLGASGFGQIAFATALVAHLGNSLVVGVGEVGARDIALAPRETQSVASIGLTLRLLAAFVAVLGIVTASFALPLDSSTRTVTWLYALSVIPLALNTGWAYKGLGNTARLAVSMLLSSGIALVLVLVFVESRDDLLRVPIIQIAGDLTAAALLGVALVRGRWKRPSFAEVRDLAMRSRMVTLSRTLRTAISWFGIVLLGLILPAAEVGLYSAAYRIVFFVMAIIVSAHAAFIPEVSRSAHDPENLSGILSRAIGLSMAVTIPFVVGGILIAPAAMNLVFGPEFRGGAAALQVLLLALLLLGVHGATRNVFLALERTGLETGIVAAGVAVNVVLSLLLIPSRGIVGAAIATLAGDALIVMVALTALARLGIRPGARESLPAAASGTLLAIVLFAFGTARSPLQTVLLGAVAYTLSIVALTLLSRRRGVSLVPEAR